MKQFYVFQAMWTDKMVLFAQILYLSKYSHLFILHSPTKMWWDYGKSIHLKKLNKEYL